MGCVFYTNFTVDKINSYSPKSIGQLFVEQEKPSLRDRTYSKKKSTTTMFIFKIMFKTKLLIAQTRPLSAVAAPKMFSSRDFLPPVTVKFDL